MKSSRFKEGRFIKGMSPVQETWGPLMACDRHESLPTLVLRWVATSWIFLRIAGFILTVISWGIDHCFPHFIGLFTGLLPVCLTRVKAYEDVDSVLFTADSPGSRASTFVQQKCGSILWTADLFWHFIKNDFMFKYVWKNCLVYDPLGNSWHAPVLNLCETLCSNNNHPTCLTLLNAIFSKLYITQR